MPFQAPKTIPGLSQESDRALHKALTAIEIDLGKALAPDLRVTDVKTAKYTVQFGELVPVLPLGAGLQLSVPTGNTINKGQRAQIALLSVVAGTVLVKVLGDAQFINAAASLTLSAPGLYDLVSVGPDGWSATPVGSGSGGLADGVYGSITVSGGGTILQITDGVYGDITVSGGGTVWTVTAGTGTDPRIFAWWGV